MKKRQLGLVVLLFALMVLCACGSSSQDEPDFTYIPKADEYYDETTPDAEKEANVSAIEVRNVGDFSSGRAWIEYVIGDQTNRFLGCIDKNGSLLFSFDRDDIKSHTEFENGLSWIFDKQGEPYVVNDQGEIMMYPSEIQFDGIASRGDGYLLAYKNKEGFDSDEYLFLIINSEGDVVKEISSKDCTQITWEDFELVVTYDGLDNNIARYCGDGIFQFMKSAEYAKEHTSYSTSKCLYTFYNVSNDTFFEKECNLLVRPTEVEDGMCRLWVDGEDVLFDIASQTDNLEQVKQWKEFVWSNHKDVASSCGPVSNCRMVYTFYNSYESHRDDPIYACAYADRTGMYPIEAYCEYMSAACSARLSFDQTADRLLLRFIGKDSNYYLAIIDSEGTTIMEPLKCEDRYSSDFFNCGRFIAGTEDNIMIYDTDGNAVFSLNDIGGSSISEFSDDVAIIDRNESWAKAVDIYGNILFDSINIASNQYLTLSSG